MTPYIIFATIDLDKPSADIPWKTLATVGNQFAHKIVLHTVRHGMPIYMSDEYRVLMYAVDSAGVTHYVKGSIDEDGNAVVTLTKECYERAGALTCTVIVDESSDGAVGAIFAAARIVMNVIKADGDYIDVTNIMTIEEFMEMYESAIAAADEIQDMCEDAREAFDQYANRTGIIIGGQYNTYEDLINDTAGMEKEAGDAYAVRNGDSWDVYIWDAVQNQWVNFGGIRGVKGEPGESWKPTPVPIQLPFSGWEGNMQTVEVTGVSDNCSVIVTPAPDSVRTWASAGVICTAQTSNGLEFTAEERPVSDMNVNVLII